MRLRSMDKRSLKNFLIDPFSQTKFVGQVLLLLLISNLVFLAFTFMYFQYIGLEMASLDCAANFVGAFQTKVAQYTSLVVSGFVLLSLMTTVLVIYRSHSIVGPICRMEKYIKDELLKGNYESPLILRKGDHFEELGSLINQLREELQRKG